MYNRIVNLNLFTIKFPITAIVSILHRVSGVLLFFGLPLLLWILSESLTSRQTFESIRAILSSTTGKFILWLSYSALIYHLLAGIRHIFIDLGIGRNKQDGKITGITVLVISIMSSIWLGVGIW